MKNLRNVLVSYSHRVTKLAKLNVGAYRRVNGKNRRIDSSGALRKSISSDVKTAKDGFTVNFYSTPYGIYVDQGRKPGKGVPVDALVRWIKTKPVRARNLKTGSFVQMTDLKLKSMSFLINRKIKTYGIPATNFYTEPFEAELIKYEKHFLTAMGQDIDEQIDKII